MSDGLGQLFRMTSFGESHGTCVGVVVEGCPAGLALDAAAVQRDLDRRASLGQPGSTPRREPDAVRILSGLYQGRTTGAPLCMMVDNLGADSAAYTELIDRPRPGHADYVAGVKYGGFNDPRGGGRFSGRITAGFVMAGAVARAALACIGVEIDAHTVAIGGVESPRCDPGEVRQRRAASPVSCCDAESSARMVEAIECARQRGDSIGGVVECVVRGLPTGVGEPACAGIESELARGVFSIPAVKGVEFGDGFALSRMCGSASNDPFVMRNGQVSCASNHAGGILGGITTGMPLVLRAAFKPTPSIAVSQRTVNLNSGEEVEQTIHGRHDACIVPRAVVVVEAMVAITLCDLLLQGGFMPKVMRCQ